MATDFTLNGTSVMIAPYSQKWRQVLTGRDHTKRAIYAGNEEIDLLFDGASITMARHWLEAASGASVNITVLRRYSLGWTDLSAVQLEVVEAPAVEAGIATPWTMIIRGASPTTP